MALAHAVSDKVEQAYQRGTLLQKRVQLMDEWARYCEDGADVGSADSVDSQFAPK